MNHELLVQRISYLLEHGGIYVDNIRRGMVAAACAGSFLLGAVFDDSGPMDICFPIPHVLTCSAH